MALVTTWSLVNILGKGTVSAKETVKDNIFMTTEICMMGCGKEIANTDMESTLTAVGKCMYLVA